METLEPASGISGKKSTSLGRIRASRTTLCKLLQTIKIICPLIERTFLALASMLALVSVLVCHHRDDHRIPLSPLHQSNIVSGVVDLRYLGISHDNPAEALLYS